MPIWHWLVFAVAAIISCGLTYAVRQFVLATKIGLSVPRERDVHTTPIPRLGGVAVSLSFIITCVAIYLISRPSLTFIPDTFLGIDRNFFGIIAGCVLLMIVGVVDDIKGLTAITKLFFHILAGVILAASTVLITHLSNPFGSQIMVGQWSFIIVVIWVVAMINVINFLDGLDGLASGISLIATIILYILAIKPEVNQLSMSVLAIALAGSLVGFLPFNFYPAKLFLGDSGSQVLGFLLAVFAIISGGKLATAFLVLGVPILDVVWVVLRRLMTHQPIYKADRFHLHHRLLNAGLSQREAVILLYTLSAAFGIVALQTHTLGKFIAALALIAIMIIGGGILVLVAAWKRDTQRI